MFLLFLNTILNTMLLSSLCCNQKEERASQTAVTQPSILSQMHEESQSEDGGKIVNITELPAAREESPASDDEQKLIPRLVEEKEEKEEGWKAKLQGIYNYFKGVES